MTFEIIVLLIMMVASIAFAIWATYYFMPARRRERRMLKEFKVEVDDKLKEWTSGL